MILDTAPRAAAARLQGQDPVGALGGCWCDLIPISLRVIGQEGTGPHSCPHGARGQETDGPPGTEGPKQTEVPEAIPIPAATLPKIPLVTVMTPPSPSLPLSPTSQPPPPRGLGCDPAVRRGGAQPNTHSGSSRSPTGRSWCPFAQSKAQEGRGRLWTRGSHCLGAAGQALCSCPSGPPPLWLWPVPSHSWSVPEPRAAVIQSCLTSTWPHLPRWPPSARGWGGQGGQSRPGPAE